MIVFPAVDIKDGKCVRLKQGLADQVTVFNDDPVDAARHWQSRGARYLHVIDLDGAFDGHPANRDLIRDICSALSIPVQLGGGIRDIETTRSYIDAGVTRLIIGTMALENQDLFGELCATFPGHIGVSLDAVDGRLKTKGWVEDSGQTVFDVIPRLEAQGASFIIYTDISRDGMQSGVNVAALERLCEATSLPVIAAGGVATMADIRNLHPLCGKGLQGAITGKAVYDGTLDLEEANRWIDAQA
ncbi:phosphoribosylformimino-5-aminoimidazole carboxamide ribotide isomerase [Desulfobaculum xiamenense]|uniref:1-(5-phosphoribosyl)-5-[(5-phosphoribosylamino)methylideneamino] imidazole-4-carboxamide isomerase n=1 Tax=Desulfobaculum xiamenense TaxID=995050 RepID=A0A846QQ96_9BACT|nr:phosphoribosylformimino-5-aminoimidazole carboxamide ribotide isomerase [Desulfobaculum xiamenense]